MNPALTVKRPAPCERCRRNRWKTRVKRWSWTCRNCGHVRDSETTAA